MELFCHRNLKLAIFFLVISVCQTLNIPVLDPVITGWQVHLVFCYKSVYLHQNQICIVLDLFHLNWKMLMVNIRDMSLPQVHVLRAWQFVHILAPHLKEIKTMPGWGALGYEGGGGHGFTYFAEERVFLRPPHFSDFVKEGYFFVSRYEV